MAPPARRDVAFGRRRMAVPPCGRVRLLHLALLESRRSRLGRIDIGGMRLDGDRVRQSASGAAPGGNDGMTWGFPTPIPLKRPFGRDARWSWTSGNSSSGPGEAIMTPLRCSPARPSRGWKPWLASSSGTAGLRRTPSRRHSSGPGVPANPTAGNPVGVPGSTRSYNRFTGLIDDTINGRILNGYHFRTPMSRAPGSARRPPSGSTSTSSRRSTDTRLSTAEGRPGCSGPAFPLPRRRSARDTRGGSAASRRGP